MDSEIVLYGHRISPFVEKVLRALELKGLRYRQDVPSRAVRKAMGPGPGKIPVLRVGETWIDDSTFILRELDRIRPEPPLFSSDPVVAAEQRLLEDWADEALYFCVYAIRWADHNADATRAELARLLKPRIPKLVFNRFITKLLRDRPRVQGLGLLPYDVLIRETALRLDDVVTRLGDGPFFHSVGPSAADLAVYGQLSTSRSDATPDLAALVAERPALLEFMAAVEAHTGGKVAAEHGSATDGSEIR